MFHIPSKVANPRYFKHAPLPSLRLLPLAIAVRLHVLAVTLRTKQIVSAELVPLAVNRPPAEG
jgi:hypothetical protein